MGIYIKGMEMPKDCDRCRFSTSRGECYATGGFNPYGARPDWCPLVEIPKHGRLIDADALTDAIDSTDWYHQAPNKEMVHGANSAEHQAWYKEQDVYSVLENAPTIIEEEGE